MVEKWDYKKPLIVSCIISAVAMLGGFLAGKNIPLAVVCFTIDYAAEALPCAITLSMLADTLEYGELKFGKKITGLGFAANSFATKAGPAFGGFLVSMLLLSGKLDTAAGIGGAQPASALIMLRVSLWVIPAILSFLMIVFVKMYPLDKKKYEQVIQELKG